jgi:rare lipoprotein A
MNQNRWTRLATVVLTTVIGPIATVQASTLPSLASKYIPVSPQSLPTITPLVVTELQTDAVISNQIKPVPLVSRLPIVTPLHRKHKAHVRSKQHKVVNSQRKTSFSQLPVVKLPVINPLFNSDVRVAAPIGIVPAIVNPVMPLPATILAETPKNQISAPFTAPSTTVAKIVPAMDKLQPNSSPQVSPIASQPKDLDHPMFESGVPVFGINNGQTPQIVNTVIAQVGETIVAPEPSIAIPVETPKQPITPTLPVPEQSIVKIEQPAATIKPATGIVKIEQPTATIKPTLDKIIATQSGQASWYGIEGGSQTANGERYLPNGLTAAHRTLPFGTKVRVTSIKTGKAVTVRINDRGPFHSRRIIDVSAGAAEVIGIKDDGIGDVKMEVLSREG